MAIWKHIKYRLTRAKTYVGMFQAALATAIPYMMGTPYATHASYALAASSFAESTCVPTTRLRRSTSATCRICSVASSVPGTSSTASSRAVRNASESCFTAEP